jgi:hypothetical protein
MGGRNAEKNRKRRKILHAELNFSQGGFFDLVKENWDYSPKILTVADRFLLLRPPLRIVLRGDVNDYEFCVASNWLFCLSRIVYLILHGPATLHGPTTSPIADH